MLVECSITTADLGDVGPLAANLESVGYWPTWADGERLAFDGDHRRFSLMTPNFTP